jgi:ferritin-like metal-binding protein YciE
MSRTPQEQLVHYLSDMYSVEQQALAQMVSAPKMAGDPGLADSFRLHYSETEEQANLVRQRLEANGGSPSKIKDMIMKLGGKGFLLFARVMPETPGRLVVHSYSYEAMEWAGYEMLIRFAERAGDLETVAVGKAIRDQERAMMQRLERGFDAAEEASHAEVSNDKLLDHIVRHLAEVHAFESQNCQLLEKSENIAGSAKLASIYERDLNSIREHRKQVEKRLEALDTGSSKLMDSALAAGGLNWGLFFQAQSDTPAKLAAFVYAVLHLEIGGYEMLKRTARRGADEETAQLCDKLIGEKSGMAGRLTSAFDSAVEATLVDLRS